MDIQISKATLNDLEAIDNIENELSTRILSQDILKSSLNNSNIHSFVAIVNNKIVGYLMAEFLIDHIDILSIAVKKEFRQNNVASKLIDKLFEIANDLKVDYIYLEVRASNLPAIKFYEKNGFNKITIRAKYYPDNNEDAYIYTEIIN